MYINKKQADWHLFAYPCQAETEYFKTPLSKKVRILSVNASDNIKIKTLRAKIKHIFNYNSRR